MAMHQHLQLGWITQSPCALQLPKFLFQAASQGASHSFARTNPCCSSSAASLQGRSGWGGVKGACDLLGAPPVLG